MVKLDVMHMIEPTQELQKHWDSHPDGAEMKEHYYAGNDFIKKVMNWISTATLDELEGFINFLENDIKKGKNRHRCC